MLIQSHRSASLIRAADAVDPPGGPAAHANCHLTTADSQRTWKLAWPTELADPADDDREAGLSPRRSALSTVLAVHFHLQFMHTVTLRLPRRLPLRCSASLCSVRARSHPCTLDIDPDPDHAADHSIPRLHTPEARTTTFVDQNDLRARRWRDFKEIRCPLSSNGPNLQPQREQPPTSRASRHANFLQRSEFRRPRCVRIDGLGSTERAVTASSPSLDAPLLIFIPLPERQSISHAAGSL